MKSISIYQNKGTWIHKVHPYTKLLYVLTAILLPFLIGQIWMFPIMILCSLVLLAVGKSLKSTGALCAFSFTIIFVIFLVQGLFNVNNTTVLFNLGPLTFYQEGVNYAVRLGLNILNMLFAFAVFVLTTNPVEFVDELEKSGFSPKFGYVINSAFQIIPQMMGTKDTITDAQRSRGMETEGSLFTRMKAFIPLISPVVMSSLINTRERAIALEVRGFGRKTKKTWLYDRQKHEGDQYITIVLVIILLAAIVWRVS